jgi:hypothetical protein
MLVYKTCPNEDNAEVNLQGVQLVRLRLTLCKTAVIYHHYHQPLPIRRVDTPKVSIIQLVEVDAARADAAAAVDALVDVDVDAVIRVAACSPMPLYRLGFWLYNVILKAAKHRNKV